MYQVSIEYRYRRHKLSSDTKHYEVLFGVLETLGTMREEELVNLLEDLLDHDDLRRVLADIRERRKIRLYLRPESFTRLLEKLGETKPNLTLKNYDYVIVLEPLD